MYEEYSKNPAVTRQRMFYEAMEDVLPGLKVIIESPSGDMQTIYPIEPFTGGTDAGNGNGTTGGNGTADQGTGSTTGQGRTGDSSADSDTDEM